jgi:tetratricopeptide (TPR) repeat protein
LKSLFVFFVLLVYTCKLSAQTISITAQLDEAEAYLTVNPAQTLKILHAIKDLASTPQEQQMRWYLLQLRAAVPTNQIDTLYPSLEFLFSRTESEFFTQNSTSILSGLGIWLRRNDYFSDAQTALQCASDATKEPQLKLMLLNSLALVSRQIGDYKHALTIYSSAIGLAEEKGYTNVSAMFHNNMGLLALEQGDFAFAKTQLRQSLEQYQSIDKRAGVISASINLLYVALMQNDLVDFERLHDRTQALTDAFPSKTKKALLFWLKTRYDQLNQIPISEQQKVRLLLAYSELADDKVRLSVHKYLAPELNVTTQIPVTPPVKSFTAPWFSQVKVCKWRLE